MNTSLFIGTSDLQCQIIAEILKEFNLTLTKAINWEEAWPVIQNSSPALVVGDLQVVDRSLMEFPKFLREFKNEDKPHNIPLIILCLAEYWDIIKPGCFSRYFADAYVEKPINLQELRGTVQFLLQDCGYLRKTRPIT